MDGQRRHKPGAKARGLGASGLHVKTRPVTVLRARVQLRAVGVVHTHCCIPSLQTRQVEHASEQSLVRRRAIKYPGRRAVLQPHCVPQRRASEELGQAAQVSENMDTFHQSAFSRSATIELRCVVHSQTLRSAS